MENQLPAIAAIVFVFFLLLLYINRRTSQKNSDQSIIEWLKTVQNSLEQTNKIFNQTLRDTNLNINSTLSQNSKILNERLDNATKVIADVQKNIGEMSEIGRGMKELQDFLRNPKLRGNIGEQVLKELLGQMLPKQSFFLQYGFKSGNIVDAAIKTEAGLIPIDSKFPMENFRKLIGAANETEKKGAEKEFAADVKKHIDAISKKYILTDEGTIDYALMYVPSEAVYYEIVNNPLLFDYSSEKRVLPVSPVTFYAYLKAILMGFEGQRISQKAQEILKGIRSIQKEYEKLGEDVDVLGKHINNSYNMMSNVQMGINKLGQKISSTNSLSKEEKELLEESKADMPVN
ncbi:DNA recombination protein RmuC [Candidatus Parcubacteria bacterium]|nr:MAG: DNA recombination protein RmuC [Candidatus Parcubacteria bacterium]